MASRGTALADGSASFGRGSVEAGTHLPSTAFALRVTIAALIVLVIFSVALLLWSGIHVLLEAFAGILVAVLLTGISGWLEQHTRLSYRWALLVAVLGLFLLAGGLAYVLWSRLSVQIGELLETLPRSLQQMREYLEQFSWGRYLVENAPQSAPGLKVGSFTQLTGFVSGLAGFLEAVIVILIVGIFGAAEPRLYKTGLLYLVPRPHRLRAGDAVDAIFYNLRQWLLGQLVLMLVIGATTTVGLSLIGVPLALSLGVIAGILEMVPYLGAIASFVPAAMVALLKGPEYVAFTAGLYLFLHILEGYVLLPLIQRRAVHLPPALTLVAQALLGELLGILGLFVAAPLTVSAMVLLKMLYVEDTLGEHDVDVLGEPKPS